MFFNFFCYSKEKGVKMKKFSLFLLLLLTGCGFGPLYSEQNNPVLANSQISVASIPNQYGDQMRRIIQNTFPSSDKEKNSKYRLVVTPPTFSSGDKTISNNEFASMMQVIAKSSYSLENIQTKKIVLTNNVEAIGSYSVVRSPYATTVAKDHIHQELSEQLAKQIALDIMAKLSQELS